MVSVQIAALAMVLSASGETALLDFHAPWCAPCRSMEGTIDGLQRAGYPVRKVNIDQDRSLARQFGVQSVPCFVLVVDGREVGRMVGIVRRDELEALFARGGVRPRGGSQTTTRAQSPDPPRRAARGPSAPRLGRAPAAAAPLAAVASPPATAIAQNDLINVSVRLRISDPQGFSNGSGTVIDARQGEALVLTCGHIFRDSQGQGEITVDFCRPGGPQKLPGRVVSYDLKSDVALVSIRPGQPVPFAPLAPKGYQVSKGDRVMTVGCNNGGPATVEQSSVTAVNKFLPPPNLSVAGMPVQGRSGGGLFTADGRVIGVCNAADPTDQEGLYAALASIHAELDEAGLSAIYQNQPPAAAVVAAPAAPAGRGAQVVPTSASGPGAVRAAALGQVHGSLDGAEVICIVRSLGDRNAKTEVIRLDRASPDFLRQLAADRQAQQAEHLTSLKVRQAPPARGTPRRPLR